MLTIRAMTGGETYAAHHLSNNDYYAVGETITGEWIGRGAQLLGLEGAVTMEQFDAIRKGVDPSTGEFLRQRQSADRFNELGEKLATARNLYDFTISAPKALSVQALEDPRLIEAHKVAVAETAQEMESVAGARIRKLGANDTRVTSNLVIARYDHDTSRELDPQIHSHLVAGNLTYDGVEGKWKALQASAIYAQREYLTEVYRNALAREVTNLGYPIEDRFEHGKDRGFGITGIWEGTLDKYSQRSAQRDQAISEFLDQNGRLPSNNEIARLVRDTRPEKLTEISTADVKAGQLGRLDAAEAQILKGLRQAAVERGSAHEQAPAAPSLVHAREHLFERVSVAKDYELQTAALRHGRGRVELPELKAALLAEVASGAMLTARGEVATKQSLERERQMVATINEGIGKYQPLGRARDFVVSDRLRPEQKTVVLAVLGSRDLAVNLRGAAGTGKTATLQELHRGLNEARRSVVAVAPTTSAVEELQKVSFPQAMTVARLLADPQQRDQLAGQVLIVDEAGMVASKDMAELIGLAKTKGARIVYSGDTAQLKSVSEGDALRVLERESNLKSVSLLQVQRQTNAEYKAAVEALRNHPADGFSKLEAMGAIREVDWRLRAQEVSKAYRQAAALPNVKGKERSVLVVAATHDEIKSVTYAIRQDRQRAGELSKGETFLHHTALDWTEAQKKQTKNYQAGQVLAFHKAVKGVTKNEALEVVSADKSAVTVRKANGETLKISGRQAKSFGVFEKQEIEVSAGDKLLLKANWRSKNFRATNGELVTVARVEPGLIKLDDGRQLPVEYRQFAHGYAVTAHRSQGKTVDFEIIAAERMAQDLFYVSATRAREGLTVITSDSLGLQESIGVSGDRQSASELARRAATALRAQPLARDDLFRLYRSHQVQQKAPRPILQQELNHHVSVHHTGLGIGF
jgi:conjugative relaxase-like TrwC/TraI family protein